MPSAPDAAPATIILCNIKKHVDYVKFMNFIKSGVKGVRYVRVRKVEWKTAEIEADIRGRAKAIITELAGAKQISTLVKITGDNVPEVIFLR